MAATSRALRHPSLYPGIQRVTEIKAIMHVESFVAQAKASAHAADEAGATPPSVQPIPSSALRPTAVGRVNALRPYQQYPQDGWVLLTEQDHAIMEFRPTHPDSTNCMLKGTFPMRHALEHKLLTIEVDDPAQDAPLIQASVLSGSTISEFSHITWITRPNVRDDLGTLDAAFGVDWQTRSFACTPGERVLVELACVGSGCRIEYNWLEESALPRFGIELAQVQ
ncbi:hypothetical protein SCP_0505410 [Sparassis crispa]|uniref:Ubiquitin 3 binding protein But2 C-terminal domain-containing protein n=1 Tax=Sparassis crispa TaxID=139825 RepID=A0A401GMT0_9APHY|nr:hypothetical protein SCP_0505410 [Sparassis crispa]GBE83490.1 hypothetical protein SCP_0505410 [Sparassis crispa]